MPPMHLLFGVHNHQPVGNFAEVFQKGDQQCYRPFIETLYRFPQIKATIHFSGSLIDWLLQNDPQLLEQVKKMVQRSQVEILTGGYYEPILPIIPEEDIYGQVNLLTNFIKDYFETEPLGCWIGERVWEPRLTRPLASAGVKYIILDDFHFLQAGIKEEALFGYYLTREEVESLAAFPVSKKLRYIIPFSLPQEPVHYLRHLASKKKAAVATIVDDGEKFGLWPGTNKLVYQQKWLEKFFRLLIKNQHWLTTLTISEYMQKYKPLGVVHLPPASYPEMMDWSGGNFRNFFAKYPEANNLHQRMLYASAKVNQETKTNETAKRYLYMGQCNCPYWHGVFGGIYLTHLRHAVYKNLITAESALQETNQNAGIEIELLDFDKDGADELMVKNQVLNVFLTPELGAGIFELDYLPKATNLLDTMSRRPEAYHEKIRASLKRPFKLRREISSIHDLLISKERGLEKFLIYDCYRRISLLEHFLPKELTLGEWKQGRYIELGDFINARYAWQKKKDEHQLLLIFERQGELNCRQRKIPLRINKQLSLNAQDAQILIEYNLENLGQTEEELFFALEFNLAPGSQNSLNNLCCVQDEKEELYSLKEDVDTVDLHKLHFRDVGQGIESIFSFDRPASVWAWPLETVSCSEQGFERNYQQTVILPRWPIRLEKSWQMRMTWQIHPLS